MDDAKIRAWWSHRQALDGRLAGQGPAAVLEQTGWARSVGGAAPYLTLFARGGIGRAADDEAVARLEIHELPAARGCTYVVPACDFPLALKTGAGFREADLRVARKLGVTATEVHHLSEAVLAALEGGPLDPGALRNAVGGAARSLGEEGKKKGLNTTLPLALGRLQSSGDIRRMPMNGRLDQQRYRYARWSPNPLSGFRLSLDEAYVELARRFFTWIAPATLHEFSTFAGLGVKAGQAATAPLKLEPLSSGDDRLMLPGDRARFEAFQIPSGPEFALVSSLDGISLLRRDLRCLLTPENRKRCVPLEKGHGEIGTLQDLPAHAILDRGEIAGLWLFDTAADSIVWMSFAPESAALLDAVDRTERFIRADLGDARSFSLDSPKSRMPLIRAMQSL